MPTDDQPHRTFSKTDSKSARCSELNPLRLEDTSIPGDICQSWHFYNCTRSHILTRYPKAYPSCGRRHCWSPAAPPGSSLNAVSARSCWSIVASCSISGSSGYRRFSIYLANRSVESAAEAEVDRLEGLTLASF